MSETVVPVENGEAARGGLLAAIEKALGTLIDAMDRGGPHARLDLQIGAQRNAEGGYDLTLEQELQLATWGAG
jgi:uncharacterized protein YidB (DUF937 family)